MTPPPLPASRWSPEQDARLRTLRAEGHTWAAIAVELGTGREATRERGRRIGAIRQPRPRPIDFTDPANRPPLPPGHPLSWGLLTAGTVLAGEAYPFPVFL